MKLKAFSLLEIVISLFLSSIVISAVYSGYVFTHKQFFKFTDIKTEIRNYFELSEVLNREFYMAKKVLKKGERKIEIQMMDKTINYSFDNDFIVRSIEEQTDTFLFKIDNVEINSFNLESKSFVDYMVLTMDRDKYLSLYKSYGAIVQLEKEDGDRY